MNHFESDKLKGIALKFELDLSNGDCDDQEIAYLINRIQRLLQKKRDQFMKKENPITEASSNVLTPFKQWSKKNFKGNKFTIPKKPNGVREILCFGCGGRG